MVGLTSATQVGGPEARAVACASTDLPPCDRAHVWRSAIERQYPGLAVDWLDDAPVSAWFRSRPFCNARVTEISNTATRASRLARPDDPDGWLLVLQVAGRGRYRHAGREVVQRPGDLVLIDCTRAFDAVYPSGLDLHVWSFPRAALAPLLAEPERAVARRIEGAHGPGGVLAAYARTLTAQAGSLDVALQRPLWLQLCNLTALALGATVPVRETARASYRAARRQRILAYVEAHLAESDLSAERAARELGMSRRWLHALLSDGGFGFADWVVRRRLEECRRLLDDPACDHLSITRIALDCGFNDLSTFNRRYRLRYRMSPRETRHQRAARLDMN